MSMSVDSFVGGPGGEIDWAFPTLDEGATARTVQTLEGARVHIPAG